jgi:hypothetical protein
MRKLTTEQHHVFLEIATKVACELISGDPDRVDDPKDLALDSVRVASAIVNQVLDLKPTKKKRKR